MFLLVQNFPRSSFSCKLDFEMFLLVMQSRIFEITTVSAAYGVGVGGTKLIFLVNSG